MFRCCSLLDQNFDAPRGKNGSLLQQIEGCLSPDEDTSEQEHRNIPRNQPNEYSFVIAATRTLCFFFPAHIDT